MRCVAEIVPSIAATETGIAVPAIRANGWRHLAPDISSHCPVSTTSPLLE